MIALATINQSLTMKQSFLAVPLLVLGLGLASCGGDNKPSNETSETSGGATSEQPATVASGDAVHGQQVYATTCTPCHGTGGKGDGPAAAALNPKPADHTSKEVIGARTDAKLAEIIKMGGGVVGKPTMPAAPQLSETDVKDVIAYLRQLSGTNHQ